MMYIQKPVKIEAIQWTGDNYQQIKDFLGEYLNEDSLEKSIKFYESVFKRSLTEEELENLTKSYSVEELKKIRWPLQFNTYDHFDYVNIGDYVIKDNFGYCYPCREELFKILYEKVEE